AHHHPVHLTALDTRRAPNVRLRGTVDERQDDRALAAGERRRQKQVVLDLTVDLVVADREPVLLLEAIARLRLRARRCVLEQHLATPHPFEQVLLHVLEAHEHETTSGAAASSVGPDASRSATAPAVEAL